MTYVPANHFLRLDELVHRNLGLRAFGELRHGGYNPGVYGECQDSIICKAVRDRQDINDTPIPIMDAKNVILHTPRPHR